ncbi:unnamed protein product [Chilo suppressalis]|uniref:Cytochrome P450 n=1 Tax=Chilo suppressalis TaxID=168631 RepID=A0ABN8EG63_CHISP|nr:unnamed protein product [Chilo suppressalis]
MFVTVFLTLGLAVSLWLRWRHQHRGLLKAAQQFPGPKTLPGLGNAMMFMCKPEEMVKQIKNLFVNYGDIVRFWLGPDLNIVVACPDELKVLLTNSKMSVKGPQYKYMADLIGRGLLSGSGPEWSKHRKIAKPNFGKRAIESYTPVFNDEVSLLLEELRRKPHDQQFNIYRDIVNTTSYSVCRTLMGLTKEQTMNIPGLQEIIEESPSNYKVIFDRMTKWYLQIDPVFWLTSQYRLQKRFSKLITIFGKDIVKHRREHLKNITEDFKLEHMEMEEDGMLSVVDRFILSGELDQPTMEKEIFTVFTASQESTAKTASYLLLMMAYHPDCQEKLYNEIKSILGDSDRDVTDDDLKRMPYMEMVLKEVARLFPIGAILQRTVAEDIAIRSGYLPAGSSMSFSVFHLHRDPRFWDNPDAFDPERFNPENTERRHQNAYIPFSLGPMNCLGRSFATKLVKTICGRILREFEVTSQSSYEDLRLAIYISVVAIGGFPVILKKRNSTK